MRRHPKIPARVHRSSSPGIAGGRLGRLSPFSGFSLVEVMVAILILGVALVGLTQGISLAVGSTKESEVQTTAALLAAGLIETLRSDPALTDGATEGDWGSSLELYRWQQTVTSTSIPGLHDVSVVVENSHTGRPIYELRTMLFQPPEDSTAPPAGANRRRTSR